MWARGGFSFRGTSILRYICEKVYKLLVLWCKFQLSNSGNFLMVDNFVYLVRNLNIKFEIHTEIQEVPGFCPTLYMLLLIDHVLFLWVLGYLLKIKVEKKFSLFSSDLNLLEFGTAELNWTQKKIVIHLIISFGHVSHFYLRFVRFVRITLVEASVYF